MNIHAEFFCGDGVYPEIWGKGAKMSTDCKETKAPGGKGATTYQFDMDPEKSSNPKTIFCELATHHKDTMSLEAADDEAAKFFKYLQTINMWKQQVRPFIFYHESIHWKRISKYPWIGTTIGVDDRGEAITEKYALKDIMALDYSTRRRNAENWVSDPH